MQSRLTLTLDTTERNALRELALYEYREIHQQAAVIIRDELMRRGFLKSAVTSLDKNQLNKQITLSKNGAIQQTDTISKQAEPN